MRVFSFSFVVLLAMVASVPASWADQRLDTHVDISLRPVKSDGETRYYQVAGRPEPMYWDPVLPIQKGDSLEIRALPVSGERRIDRCSVRLDGAKIEEFKTLPPYEVWVETSEMSEGWHKIEIFCQQESSHPMRASGSLSFLLVQTLEDPTSVARIATLERLASELARQSAEQKSAYEAEKARQDGEQAGKVRRWQEAIAVAKPIVAGEEVATTLQPGEGGWRLEGALVTGGGISYSAPPSERHARPTSPRKVTLQSIGEVTILVPERHQPIRVDYEVSDGRKLSKNFVVNRKLTLQGVSVPITITATLGNCRVSRELTCQNPTAIFNFERKTQ